jgi:hypothetical protein
MALIVAGICISRIVLPQPSLWRATSVRPLDFYPERDVVFVSTTNTNTFPLGLIHTVPGSCISKCGRSAHFASARFFTSSGNLFAMMRVG